MRIVLGALSALTKFKFKSNSECLEDIVPMIDTPLLDHFEIASFNQLRFYTLLPHYFISWQSSHPHPDLDAISSAVSNIYVIFGKVNSYRRCQG